MFSITRVVYDEDGFKLYNGLRESGTWEDGKFGKTLTFDEALSEMVERHQQHNYIHKVHRGNAPPTDENTCISCKSGKDDTIDCDFDIFREVDELGSCELFAIEKGGFSVSQDFVNQRIELDARKILIDDMLEFKMWELEQDVREMYSR